MIYLLAAGAALLHEGGHLLALFLLGGKISGIRLTPFGITLCTSRVSTYRGEIALALAGPFLGLVCFLLLRGAGGTLSLFSEINLLFSLFNLLPIDGLDGGKALAAALNLFCPVTITHTVLQICTWIFLLLLWLIAVFFALFLGANLSLYALSLWLFVRNLLGSHEKKRQI